MNHDNIKTMIDEYLDGELGTEKENYLFSILSSDHEAREYFKQMNCLKTFVGKSSDAYPESLDRKIQKKINNSSGFKSFFTGRNILYYTAYAIIVILLFTGYILFNKYDSQKEQLAYARQTINKQKEVIELITNSDESPIIVNGELENKIIIKANL